MDIKDFKILRVYFKSDKDMLRFFLELRRQTEIPVITYRFPRGAYFDCWESFYMNREEGNRYVQVVYEESDQEIKLGLNNFLATWDPEVISQVEFRPLESHSKYLT